MQSGSVLNNFKLSYCYYFSYWSRNDLFFGAIAVDISASAEARQNYDEMAFPILFKRSGPELEDLSARMKEFFISYGQKPKPQVTAGYKAENILIGTEMLKFLLEEKFIVSRVYYAIEYQKGIFSTDRAPRG